MPVEHAEQFVGDVIDYPVKKKSPVQCPRCGGEHMKRLRRSGLLRGKVYSIFGFYPWRCTKCLGDFMLKRRGGTRRHKQHRPVEA